MIMSFTALGQLTVNVIGILVLIRQLTVNVIVMTGVNKTTYYKHYWQGWFQHDRNCRVVLRELYGPLENMVETCMFYCWWFSLCWIFPAIFKYSDLCCCQLMYMYIQSKAKAKQLRQITFHMMNEFIKTVGCVLFRRPQP